MDDKNDKMQSAIVCIVVKLRVTYVAVVQILNLRRFEKQ